MILIHTALLCEAMPIIEHFKLKKESGIYKNEKIWLCVLGVGKKNTSKLNEILDNYKFEKIINLGICGCSDKNINIGEIFCVNQKLNGFKFANLVCVKQPQTTIKATLCDMESDEFIKICKFRKIEYFIIKIVSDYLNMQKLDKNFVYNLIKNQICKIDKFINELK